MTTIRTPLRPATVSRRHIAHQSQFVSAAIGGLRRVGRALSTIVENGQLGPQPGVDVSRWTGGRI
jgi:hypothetical protein